MEDFEYCKPVLKQLEHALSMQYKNTNDHIQNNDNSYFKVRTNDNFTIATPKQEDEATDLLKTYFPDRHFVPLPEILSTVNAYTAFLREFQHWQQRYTKGRTDDKILYAGIIGLGCAIGIPKMSRISKLINESALQHAVNWYFSLENIRSANDCIVRCMDRMELPNIYRKNQNTLHTASDGQKFEVKTNSLNANYSFKYFGKGQGVTANTSGPPHENFCCNTVIKTELHHPAIFLNLLMDCLGICAFVSCSRFKAICLITAIT